MMKMKNIIFLVLIIINQDIYSYCTQIETDDSISISKISPDAADRMNISLKVPCLGELLENYEIYSYEIRKKQFMLGDHGFDNNLESIYNLVWGDRVTIEAGYSRPDFRLQDDNNDRLELIDDGEYVFEGEIVYKLPFNLYTEYKKNSNINKLKRHNEIIEQSKIDLNVKNNIVQLYQDFEILHYTYENCICSRNFETNCTIVFSKLRESVLSLFFESKFKDLDLINNWSYAKYEYCL